jgi:hypothetical protein
MSLIRVTFKLNGLLGRDVFETREYRRNIPPLTRAYFAMEWVLIDEGCPTHDCGCCVDPAHTSWEFISLEPVDAA